MTYPNVYASQTGPLALSGLDANFLYAVDIANGALTATSGGTADALTATYSPAPAALVAGLTLYLRAAQANATTTPQFSPNGLTGKVIVKNNNQALAVGDIAGAGHWLQLVYDATNGVWELMNPALAKNIAGGTQGQVPVQSGVSTTTFIDSSFAFKNRIINGAMVIDQRNAGASVATSSGSQIFAVDRWLAVYSQVSKFTLQQNAASVTPPTGFINYLGITSSSAYTVGSGEQFNIRQAIEGLNVTDLGWGTASAATITLSFWVRSSLTGTFGGCLMNGATNRSYPFTFTINAANTWELKTITVAGDTTGTWLTTNGVGVYVWFGLGVGSTLSATAGAWAAGYYPSATGATSVVGTSGATFYITGVQLEKGSTATSFDYRPYGTELQLCQRYYQQPIQNLSSGISQGGILTFFAINANEAILNNALPVPMRATPTVTTYGNTGTAGNAFNSGLASEVSGVTVDRINPYSISRLTKTTGWLTNALITCVFTASAEL
jgi:hypothetical protein